MINPNFADFKHYRISIVFLLGILVGRLFGIIGYLDTTTEPNTTTSSIVESSFPSVSFGSSSTIQQPSSTIIRSNSNNNDNENENDDGVHMLFGLSGKEPSFFNEFYVSLKSVILNAPTDMPLTIHCVADETAYNKTLPEIADQILLPNLIARQPITIVVYNMARKGFGWKKVIEKCTGHKTSKRHTMGTFFRLFAYDVLPPNVEHVVYLDTDVVIVSNLQELWKHRNSSSMFQWSSDTRCAGFMMLNVRQMGKTFWSLIDTSYPKDKPIPVLHKINDQQIVRTFSEHFPEQVSELPPEWNNHKANNFHQLNGDMLLKNRPKMGMLHFNGHNKGGGTVNVFEEPKRLEYSAVHYYVHHPWEWVGYMLQSQLPPGTNGYPASLQFKIIE